MHSPSSFSCHMSTLLPQDFICASAFDDGSVILWNFATETRHRILWPYNDLISTHISNLNDGEKERNLFKQKTIPSGKRNYKKDSTKNTNLPVSMIFDPFDAVLTIAYSSGIVQYSINGYKLRDYLIHSPYKNDNSRLSKLLSTEEEDTVKIESSLEDELEIELQKDHSANTYKNKLNLQLDSKKVSISCIGILGLDFMFNKRLIIAGLSDGSLRLLSPSPRNYSFIDSGVIRAHSSSISSILCHPQSTVCKMCQMPICSGCIINGTRLCRNCYLK